MDFLYLLIGNTAFIGAILFIFKHYLVNNLAEKHKQENRILLQKMMEENAVVIEEIKKNHQKELENYKVELGNYTRFSNEQFILYNDVYAALCDLKYSAEKLWNRANKRNLLDFARQLKIAKEKSEKSVLLMEERHYRTLVRLINAFSNFEIGKKRLIEVSEERINNNEFFSELQVKDSIRRNERVKEEYTDLLENILISFKKHIYYPNPNKRN